MKPVVIAGLVRTLDLLLNRDPHHIRICDLKLFHSGDPSTPGRRYPIPLCGITSAVVYISTT